MLTSVVVGRTVVRCGTVVRVERWDIVGRGGAYALMALSRSNLRSAASARLEPAPVRANFFA